MAGEDYAEKMLRRTQIVFLEAAAKRGRGHSDGRGQYALGDGAVAGRWSSSVPQLPHSRRACAHEKSCTPRDAKKRVHHRGIGVRVFVGVEVRRSDPAAISARSGRGIHFRCPLPDHPPHRRQTSSKSELGRSPFRFASDGISSGGATDLPPTSTRWQPTSISGMLARASYGVFESRSVGHDGGAGQNALAKRTQDAFIHAGRKAEVIRVDDQSFHWG